MIPTVLLNNVRRFASGCASVADSLLKLADRCRYARCVRSCLARLLGGRAMQKHFPEPLRHCADPRVTRPRSDSPGLRRLGLSIPPATGPTVRTAGRFR